jgi:hypothetical protein
MASTETETVAIEEDNTRSPNASAKLVRRHPSRLWRRRGGRTER